jgi:hypothetical protein
VVPSVRQAVRGSLQTVSEEKVLQKLHQTPNEWKTHTCMSVLKLPLLIEVQQKVGELVRSLTS